MRVRRGHRYRRRSSVVQTDGDAAHVVQMNRLARLLRDRLAYQRACR